MKTTIAFLATSLFAMLAIMAFTRTERETGIIIPADATYSIEIPEEVNAVLENHCFGCHNSESRNEKGRDKLSIDKLGDLPKGKLAAKLNKMVEELEEKCLPKNSSKNILKKSLLMKVGRSLLTGPRQLPKIFRAWRGKFFLA